MINIENTVHVTTACKLNFVEYQEPSVQSAQSTMVIKKVTQLNFGYGGKEDID